MKKVYVFLADGFELLEAMAPVDVLRRCGAELKTISLNENLFVKSAQGVEVKADANIDEINLLDGDVLIIPGGYPGYINLRENEKVVNLLKKYLEDNKIVGAICGGPTIFSYNNIANGINLTAHSSTKEDFKEKYNYTGENICVDKNIVTSIGAGHAVDFAFEIAKKLFDNETIIKVKKGMELI